MTSSSHGALPQTSPCSAARAAMPSGSGGPDDASSVTPQKKCSKPAGLMISIIRAGVRPAFHIPCVSPRLGDVATGAENDLPVAGPEADLSLGDDGVLILPGVQMWQHKGSHSKWMLDYGDCATGVGPPQLEGDTDRAGNFWIEGQSFAWLNDGQGWWRTY